MAAATEENKVRLAYWNVDQANREEKFPETKWDVRSPRVKSLLREQDADLIAVVELRNLKTSNEKAQDMGAQFAADGYDSVTVPYSFYEDTFYMCLMWKRSRFMMRSVTPYPLMKRPTHEKIMLAIELFDHKADLRFTACITHFPIPEEEKWTCIKNLLLALPEIKTPFFIAGDYNFFDDEDRGGKQMRQLLLDESLEDLAWPLLHDREVSVQRGNLFEMLRGNFYGYPHDEHHFPLDNMSRLDHIFARGLLKTEHAMSPSMGRFQFEPAQGEVYPPPDKLYPSDHLLIVSDFVVDREARIQHKPVAMDTAPPGQLVPKDMVLLVDQFAEALCKHGGPNPTMYPAVARIAFAARLLVRKTGAPSFRDWRLFCCHGSVDCAGIEDPDLRELAGRLNKLPGVSTPVHA